MEDKCKIYKPNCLLKILSISTVIFFSLYIMIIPVLSSSSSNREPISFIVLAILTGLFLPSILYSIIAIKTKKIENIIIPALFLLLSEYYFFNDFAIWISSSANAAIGLLIIPICLLIVLGFSYVVAFIISKIRKQNRD